MVKSTNQCLQRTGHKITDLMIGTCVVALIVVCDKEVQCYL